MARTTYVKKAQKAQGHCEKCGKEIGAGDPYKWVAPRAHRAARGFKRKRCLDCPGWRPSELTSSTALSIAYGAQETAEDALGAWNREDVEDLRSILTDAAEGLREAAETYRESAQNIEDGFGTRTSMCDELDEKADTLESSADELESVESDLEEFDEDEARTEATQEFQVWVLVNDDGSFVTEEPFASDTDADAFLQDLVAQGAAALDEVSIDTADASDFDFDGLPEDTRGEIEDKLAELRDTWAEEQSEKVSDAISSIEFP